MSVLHWAALARTGLVGGRTMTRLLERFGSAEAAIATSPMELEQVPGIGPATAAAIASLDMRVVEADCARFRDQGITIVTWQDREHYPGNLLLCDDAPPVLFVRGSLQRSDNRSVAIVGTRAPHPVSARLAYHLAGELASRGWCIVSGLALGIDGEAHRGALAAGGRTLAVLGSGVLWMYPPAHAKLAAEIMRQGAVLSELYPDIRVSPQNLIARNRITSGLSRAVIVVQSGEDSGSMSTARRARQQGRLVMAVVGGDQGCQSLLDEGAEALPPEGIDWDALAARLDAISPARLYPGGSGINHSA